MNSYFLSTPLYEVEWSGQFIQHLAFSASSDFFSIWLFHIPDKVEGKIWLSVIGNTG